jgi:[ribosomal protein S5]-alanine N-acetyltransferase
MKIVKKRLPEIDKSQIIQLCNNPLVRKHMPLAEGSFDENSYAEFITAKEKIWEECGYGPWAYILDGQFIGWGGLQPEHDDVEVVLVLHPNYWGYGKRIVQDLIHDAFENLKLSSVIILFPPSRTRIKVILKLGFQQEDEIEIEGKTFVRYRLNLPS